MANRTYAVKFTTEGQDALVRQQQAALNAYDKTIDKAQELARIAADSARKAFKANDVTAYNNALKEGERAAKAANRAIEQSYRELGVRSTQSIEEQKNRAIAAYEAIKRSGVASARDIQQAQLALKNTLGGLNAQLGQTEQAAKQSGQGFTVLRGAIATIAGNAAIAGIGALSSAFNSLTLGIFQSGFELERQKASLKAFLGSSEAVDKLLGKVRDFAATTPFELSETIDVAKQLIAAGTQSEKVVDTIRQLGAVAAGANKPLSQIAFVYNQIANQGIATSSDLNQFFNAGLSAKDFADVLGVATGEVKTLASQGKITFDVIQQVIAKATTEGGRFATVMDELGGTSAVKASNLNDAFDKIYSSIFEAINPAIGATIQLINDILAPLSENKQLFEELRKIAQEFADALKANPELATEIGRALSEFVLKAVRSIAEGIKNWQKFYNENKTAINAIFEIQKSVLGVVVKTGEALGPWLSGLNLILEAYKKIIEAASALVKIQQFVSGNITSDLPDGGGGNTLPVPSIPIPSAGGYLPPPPPSGPIRLAPQYNRPSAPRTQIPLPAGYLPPPPSTGPIRLAPPIGPVDTRQRPFVPSTVTAPQAGGRPRVQVPKPTALPNNLEAYDPAPRRTTTPKPSTPKDSRLGLIQSYAKLLGVTPEDLATIINIESGFKNVRNGGSGGLYQGFFQLGPKAMTDLRRAGQIPGASNNAADYNFEQQLALISNYVFQRGYKPGKPNPALGADLNPARALYNTINLGNPFVLGQDGFGTTGGRTRKLDQNSKERREARQYLANLGATESDDSAEVIQRRLAAEKDIAEEIKRQAEEAKRKAEEDKKQLEADEKRAQSLRDQTDELKLQLETQRGQNQTSADGLEVQQQYARALGDERKETAETLRAIRDLQQQIETEQNPEILAALKDQLAVRQEQLKVIQESYQTELQGIQQNNAERLAAEQAKRIEETQRALKEKQDIEFTRGNLEAQFLDSNAQLLEGRGLNYEAAALRERAAILRENIRLQQELLQIQEQFANQPGVAEELSQIARATSQLNIQAIDSQFQDLGETIQGLAEDLLGQLIEQLFTGQLNWQNFAKSALQAIGQVAAKILTSQILKLVGGLFGGGAGAGGGGFSFVSSAGLNLSPFGGSQIFGFASGGPVLQAMENEQRANGNRPVVFGVLTVGEEVLSIQTGEAQRYQELRRKLGSNPLERIGNYSMGGTIEARALGSLATGNTTPTYASFDGRSSSVSNTVNLTMKVSTPDVGGFRRSSEDIALRQAEMVRRLQKRE